MGGKLSERESIARSFVAKAVYGFPFTRSLIESLKTAPVLRRICGYDRVSERVQKIKVRGYAVISVRTPDRHSRV